MGPTWTQVGTMLAPWTLLSGCSSTFWAAARHCFKIETKIMESWKSNYLTLAGILILTNYGSTLPQKTEPNKFHKNYEVNEILHIKGCVSLNPSKISKSGWWGLQLDAWQLCNSLWYGLINSKLHINKKIFFLYHTTSDGVTVQCFKSPSWPLRNGLDLWPQLIYTLSWESQHKEI